MTDVIPPVRFAGIHGNASVLAQSFVGAVLHRGCTAVDATMGNGHDTLFLASRVGAGGRVYSFDIQTAALKTTRGRLQEAGLQERVKLIRDGHECMDRYLTGPVDAFLFNLGYLPGGDHAVTTRDETTTAALRIALDYLKPGGRIGIVVYTAHPGAAEESRAVGELAGRLNPRVFGVIKARFANRPQRAPYLMLIERALVPE